MFFFIIQKTAKTPVIKYRFKVSNETTTRLFIDVVLMTLDMYLPITCYLSVFIYFFGTFHQDRNVTLVRQFSIMFLFHVSHSNLGVEQKQDITYNENNHDTIGMCSCVIKLECLWSRTVAHFTPMFHFYTPWKRQKTPTFIPSENVRKPNGI